MTKVGIVGAGFVGASAGYALLLRDVVSELVLVDIDRDKAEGEAMDLAHATPFAGSARVRAGDLADLSGASLVILAAGANQRPGESRLDLAARNADTFRRLVPDVVEAAGDPILLVASNPVDVLTHLSWRASGLDPARVIGSGTTLDTARLRTLVAERAGVSSANVHGYVLGEHGDSEVVAWSTLTLAGMPPGDFFAALSRQWGPEDEAAVGRDVREAAQAVIRRKRATYYGVGAALARVAEAVLGDERSILTVSISDGEVAYSLPRVLGRGGVAATLHPRLSEDEAEALERSAAVLREAVVALERPGGA